MCKKIQSYLTVIILFALLLFVVQPRVKAELYNNLQIHVSLVTTNADGTYTIQEEYPLENRPFVKVTHLGTGYVWKGYVNNVGWIFFTVNVTGKFRIEITYTDAQHKPREFNIDNLNTYTVLREYIFRLAVFFAGDQTTIFQKLQISLPGSVTFTFPQSNVNATIKSYGLRYNVTRTERQYTFTPWDYCDPVFDRTTGLVTLYPNYTINIKLKTMEAGIISMVVVDNATIKTYASPLYIVPRDATVEITVILETKRIPYLETLKGIAEDLDFVKRVLLEIRAILNGTVIPLIKGVGDSVANVLKFLEERFSGYTIQTILERMSNIDIEVRRTRDHVFSFIAEMKPLLQNMLSTSDKYLMLALLAISLIALAVVSYKRKEKAKSVSRGGIIVGA